MEQGYEDRVSLKRPSLKLQRLRLFLWERRPAQRSWQPMGKLKALCVSFARSGRQTKWFSEGGFGRSRIQLDEKGRRTQGGFPRQIRWSKSFVLLVARKGCKTNEGHVARTCMA